VTRVSQCEYMYTEVETIGLSVHMSGDVPTCQHRGELAADPLYIVYTKDSDYDIRTSLRSEFCSD
jgi:hypothetical protein